MKNRVIDLQLVKPIKDANKAKGKIPVKTLIKDSLEEVSVPYYDVCCKTSNNGKYPIAATEEGVLQRFDGTNWINIDIGSSNSWQLTGNSGITNSNFIGSINNNPLLFRVGNVKSGFISYSTDNVPGLVDAGGDVVFGMRAGLSSGTTVKLNTLIGNSAGRHLQNYDQSVMIGNWAGHFSQNSSDPFGGRSVLVGMSTAFRNITGSSLTCLGTFAAEMNQNGDNLTAIGRDSCRSNINGVGSVGVGALSLLYGTTGIRSINVTNGGSGYTNGATTIVISSPYGGPGPGISWGIATATPVISGGVITGITVTDPGAGYSDLGGSYGVGYDIPDVTVTIVGDGVGATAEAVLQSSDNNIGVGPGAGYQNRIGTENIYIGNISGGSNPRFWDENTINIGNYSGADSSVNSSTELKNSIAIGTNAKYVKSNLLAVGGSNLEDKLQTVFNGKDTDAAFQYNLPSTTGIDLKNFFRIHNPNTVGAYTAFNLTSEGDSGTGFTKGTTFGSYTVIGDTLASDTRILDGEGRPLKVFLSPTPGAATQNVLTMFPSGNMGLYNNSFAFDFPASIGAKFYTDGIIYGAGGLKHLDAVPYSSSWDNSIAVPTRNEIYDLISGRSGTATLVGGTVTVSATIPTGSKIYVSCNTPGGTQGFLSAPTSSIINNTSFVINSSSVTDTSTVNYWWI